MPPETVLDASDTASSTWRKLTQILTARLQALRELNDRSASAEETARTRGQIAEVKRTIALGTQPSALEEGIPIEQLIARVANSSNDH